MAARSRQTAWGWLGPKGGSCTVPPGQHEAGRVGELRQRPCQTSPLPPPAKALPPLQATPGPSTFFFSANHVDSKPLLVGAEISLPLLRHHHSVKAASEGEIAQKRGGNPHLWAEPRPPTRPACTGGVGCQNRSRREHD